jgi:hypothetical protein
VRNLFNKLTTDFSGTLEVCLDFGICGVTKSLGGDTRPEPTSNLFADLRIGPLPVGFEIHVRRLHTAPTSTGSTYNYTPLLIIELVTEPKWQTTIAMSFVKPA